jgi:DNA modification methylase
MGRVRASNANREVLSPSSPYFTVHRGDARELDFLLKNVPGERPLLTCTITSPPYGDMKDYGHPDQIGWGQSHDDYLVELRRVFRRLFDHTRHEGSLWLIADTFRPPESNGDLRRLEPLPFQLADQAQDAGWTLRDIIVWRKDKTLPWSGRGRLRNAFEYVLFFVKSSEFKYRVDRVRDPIELEEWWVKWPERYNPEGKVPENVWAVPIPVQGSWSSSAVKHACPLPPDLVERMILLSTDPGDIVFDPFAGTGVVIAEAERLERRGLGIELVPKHVKAFATVVRPEILRRGGNDELGRRQEQSDWLQRTILNLRIVKYPKVLLQGLEKVEGAAQPLAAVVLAGGRRRKLDRDPYQLADATTIFVMEGNALDREDLVRELKDIANRQPASKFGVAGDLRVIGEKELVDAVRGRKLYLYRDGRTYFAEGPTTAHRLLELARERAKRRYPPIAANVLVQEKPRALGRP